MSENNQIHMASVTFGLPQYTFPWFPQINICQPEKKKKKKQLKDWALFKSKVEPRLVNLFPGVLTTLSQRHKYHHHHHQCSTMCLTLTALTLSQNKTSYCLRCSKLSGYCTGISQSTPLLSYMVFFKKF